MQFRNIPTTEIYALDQARKNFDERYLNELADSMREVGVLQPILVRHAPRGYDGAKWLIVAGERRWRAAQIAELAQIPAVVTDAGAADAAVMSHAENFQRRDLTAEEEASVVQELMAQGLTNVQVANELNKSAGWVNNRVQYLKVGSDVRDVGARVPKKMSALIWADKVKNQNVRKSLLRRIEVEEMPFSRVKSEVEDYLERKAIQDKADRLRAAQYKAPDPFTERARAQHERDESERERRLRSVSDATEPMPAPTRATLPADEPINDTREFEPFVSPIDVSGDGTVATIEAPVKVHDTPEPEILVSEPEPAEPEPTRAEARAAREEIAADCRRALATLDALTEMADDDTYEEIADFCRKVLRGDLRR